MKCQCTKPTCGHDLCHCSSNGFISDRNRIGERIVVCKACASPEALKFERKF